MPSEMSWEGTCWSRRQLCWDRNKEMGDVREAIHLNRLLRLSFRRRGRRAMGAGGRPS